MSCQRHHHQRRRIYSAIAAVSDRFKKHQDVQIKIASRNIASASRQYRFGARWAMQATIGGRATRETILERGSWTKAYLIVATTAMVSGRAARCSEGGTAVAKVQKKKVRKQKERREDRVAGECASQKGGMKQ